MQAKAVAHKFNEEQIAQLKEMVDLQAQLRGYKVTQSDIMQEALNRYSIEMGLGEFPKKRPMGRPTKPDRRTKAYKESVRAQAGD